MIPRPRIAIPRDGSRTLVMGIINATPDSFSDGGLCARPESALAVAERMVAEGADVIDVGGQSTRPGATPVGDAEEMDRVLPVIEEICRASAVPVSVDTSSPAVMRAAAAAGAGMINDVYALRLPGALEAARDLGVPVCLMHMQGEPRTMQQEPRYDDVVREVGDFLLARVAACERAGIRREDLVLDPGFGFGKNLTHNLDLLRGLRRLAGLGPPLLVGLSRKSFIGHVTGRDVGNRLHGSVALAVYAALNGAAMVRVHDVGPTVDALRMVEAVVREHRDG